MKYLVQRTERAMTNFWDERFSKPGYAYGTDPNDFLREVAVQLPRGRTLCLGEGEGRNAVFLAEQGHQVTAIDLSGVGLAKARELAAARGVAVTTSIADLAEYVIAPGAWDAIVSIWCHVPSALRTRLHASVVAGLRPGGAFVLEAYTPKQLELRTGGPPVEDLLVTLSSLQRELAGLELPIARELLRDVQEGRQHSGRSAVVQLLGFLRPGEGIPARSVAR